MSLLIKNVRILGGKFSEAETRDVFANGDRISAIGDFGNKNADEVVDGGGSYLSPGFIDINTDSDHYLTLFDSPEQGDFLGQGVTTIVGGMCGSSLAPLIYGSLESVQKWGDVRKMNVGWHGVAEFLSALEKLRLGVNFATLVGHATIRRAIVGESLRELTKNELKVFGRTLETALEEGALGMSSGLSYVHASKTPYAEIKHLASIVNKFGGLYATHLRKNGAGLAESVDETIRLARETGARTEISHFMPLMGAEKEYGESLRKLSGLAADADIRFDVYPFSTSVLSLYTFLPSWSQSGGRSVMLASLNDEWMRKKIEKDLPELNPEDFVVGSAPGNETLIGRSLADLADIYGEASYRAALLRLMLATELRGVIFYRNINEKMTGKAIRSPRSLIASNSASFPGSGSALKPERETKTFTKFLEIAVNGKEMALADAVKKITVDAALRAGIKNRDEIKEGNFADFAVFRVAESPVGAGKTVEVEYAAVNGQLAFKKGVGLTGKRGGRVLRRA